MKCDLHVHPIHSGLWTLKRRGMDVVTITDHDSIDAAEALCKHDDFFLSEEVSCELPSGTRLHAGVYNIRERAHVGLQRRRCDFPALFAWLRERKLLFSVNHVYSSLTGPRDEADFSLFARFFPAVEVLSGQMPEASNAAAAKLAARWGKTAVAGSDAHTIGALASAYTLVPSARSKQEFLDGLSRGDGFACGQSGNCWKLAATVFEIARAMAQEKPWAGVILAPLLAAIPVAVLLNYVRQIAFVQKWREHGVPVSGLVVESGAAL